MGTPILGCITIAFFLLCAFISSGSGVSDRAIIGAFEQRQKSESIQSQEHISSPDFTYRFDTGIVNPTTPTEHPTLPTVPTSLPPPATIASPRPPTTTTTPTTTTMTPTSSGGTWCVASLSASEKALQVALDFACGYGGADCSHIQLGGSCYNPNTVKDHASYAFNNYYRKNPSATSCEFGGTAQLAYTDPSSGTCLYGQPNETQSTTSTVLPTSNTPVTPTTSSTPTTPAVTTIPNGSNEYNNEAAYLSNNLFLLVAATCLLASLLNQIY